MKSFITRGVNTQWPFEPYEQQKEYCKRVIEAIQNKQNAILESPTGTGKTMSLLVSSLAWQQSSPEAKSIYYLSRTHIQLSQAAKEMKKTAYSKVPSVVLASRQHLCLNSDVKNQAHGSDAALNRSCRNAIARDACIYYNSYADKLKAQLDVNKVHDIEDLDAFGRKHQCCPFYASKKIAETQAALVFMPYNYILDLSVRKSTQLNLDKSVLIVDEGHNLESSLKEAASAHITLSQLKKIQECCEKLPHKLSEALMRDHGITRRKTSILDEDPSKQKKSTTKEKSKADDKPNMIEELAAKLTTERLQQVNKCARILMSCENLLKSERGRYIGTKCDILLLKAKLEEAGVNFRTSDMIIDTLESISSFWSVVGVVNPNIIAQYIAATSGLSHFIELFYPTGTVTQPKFEMNLMNLKKNYSVYMTVDISNDAIVMEKMVDWKMNLWCLNPGAAMKRIVDDSCMEGPRSIIITSGTLTPIRQIEMDLERKFPIIQEFNHLIKKEQISIKILSRSPHDYKLDLSYSGTSDPRCLGAVGETLASLLAVLPYGTLVFYPSYRLMKEVSRYCGEKTYWRMLDKSTKLFTESTEQSSFTADMMKYKSIVDAGGRATFIGVCRGKLSEGTNLERNHCRSVIVVGLPFPNYTDPQLKETLQFHDRRGDKDGYIWYCSQMRRGLCQAIGRVIRNKDDFGMVFLCDARFERNKFSVSRWIQEHYPDGPSTDYKDIADHIKQFFAQYDIDISAASLARASNPIEANAFEFAAPARNRRKQNMPLASSTLARLTNPQSKVTDANADSGPTFAERQANLFASYAKLRATNKRPNEDRPKQPPQAEVVKPKKLKTDELFDSIYTNESSEPPTNQPDGVLDEPMISQNEPPPIQNETPVIDLTESTHNDKPKNSQQGKQKCYICKNEPVMPHLTNCECSRLGCHSCLKALNNKSCGDCGVICKLKRYKPQLFNMFKKK